MDKIFTGLDRAKEMGFSSYRDYLTALGIKYNHRWNGKINDSVRIMARVDFGRWIADCQCGAANYVEPGEPFYCAECGMGWNGQEACGVDFPDEKDIIEVELMERPTKKIRNSVQKTIQAPPSDPALSRSWKPGETVEDLKTQRRGRNKR